MPELGWLLHFQSPLRRQDNNIGAGLLQEDSYGLLGEVSLIFHKIPDQQADILFDVLSGNMKAEVSEISVSTSRQFNVAVEPHIRSIRRYAISLTRNHADADDLVQDTLLRACLNLHRWRPETNMMGWLVVIMRRIFLSQYARVGRMKLSVVPLEDHHLGIKSSQDLALELRELAARWPTLSSEHREVLECIAISGESYQHMARRLCMPLGTLRCRLHRARAVLRSGRPMPRIRRWDQRPRR